MTRSSRLFLFPDINVWLALTFDAHVHHALARKWFEGLAPTSRLFFCRFTQLGFLRLLTAAAVMGASVRSQQRAWGDYDAWLEDDRVGFVDEPPTIESRFRSLTKSPQASPKDWADSYLAAFANASGLTTATLDRALHLKSKGILLLES
jgi:toxin-antitoxin system PIN domain toxin